MIPQLQPLRQPRRFSKEGFLTLTWLADSCLPYPASTCVGLIGAAYLTSQKPSLSDPFVRPQMNLMATMSSTSKIHLFNEVVRSSPSLLERQQTAARGFCRDLWQCIALCPSWQLLLAKLMDGRSAIGTPRR